MEVILKTRNQPVPVGETNYQGYIVKEQKTDASGRLVRRILERSKADNPYTAQTKINAYNFPFTYNPGAGCFFQCVYCYLRQPFFQRHVSADHGKEMNYRPDLALMTRKFLEKNRNLPQYMKRVQMGVSTEIFMPQMQEYTQMRKVLEVFRDHGPSWMIHMVTKSPAILNYADLLEEMKTQVQVEISLVTLDEGASRIFEQGTPSVKARLEIIEKLAARGIFVRLMLMPVLREYKLGTLGVDKPVRMITFRNSETGEERLGEKYTTGPVSGNFSEDEIGLKLLDGSKLVKQADKANWKPVLLKDWSLSDQARQQWRNYGAQAYKQKDLNYYHVDELIRAHEQNRAPKPERGRIEDPSAEKLIHSGESVMDDGSVREAQVFGYHIKRKDRNTPDGSAPRIMRPVMDFGYRFHSKIDWVDCI